MLFDYDDGSIDSIYAYAKRLEGMTFQDILNEYEKSINKYYVNPNEKHSDVLNESFVMPSGKARGQLGNILEAFYFGYKPNSVQDADFPKVGMELKQTPIDLKKRGGCRAGERLVITNISYSEPVENDFYNSHVWAKIKLILLIHYLRDKSKERTEYEIKYVNLFSPPQDDLSIIVQDYLKIIEKIRDGKAHEISEGDTNYLGACTKGKNAAKSTVKQYYGSHILARKRAFCFKQSYMNFVLHEYVLKDNVPYESIIKNNQLNSSDSFENQIIQLISRYYRLTDKQLCQRFNQTYDTKRDKGFWSSLTYKMLGIKSNKSEEFEKANIKVKTIRIEKRGNIKESMSFPTINFKEFVNTTYEESDFYKYFEETRFLFVVYQSNGVEYRLESAQIWNMPANDLYGDAKTGWLAIQDKIKNGITFTVQKDRVLNDLPKKTDNRILHIRPHAQKSAFKLKNGYEKGDLKRNADQLPNGEWMTKQCLWLNNSYVLSQLKKD